MLRAFQWDLARQVERFDWLLAQLPRYADWGYNELYLHLEDAIEYPSLPFVARADAYSHRQMRRLAAAADRVGIKVVPIVNLLGHTQYLIKTPQLRDLNELRAADGSPLERGQICPVHPRTLEIAEKLLRDVEPLCTAGKVHVGLDESFQLGKHPRSRREIKRIGLPAHFARYVGRLRELTRAKGLKLGMWADMLYFLPGAIPLLPRDIAVYEWYYYPFQRRPRVELFGFAETDIGERLRARGIEYWGCPMNGAFRYEPLPHFRDRLENIRSWWQRCARLDAAGMLVTAWEPNRLGIELTTVVDAAAASLWLDGVAEPRAMLERGFARVFGKARPRSAASTQRNPRPAPTGGSDVSHYVRTYSQQERAKAKLAARVALACDRHPFSGYPRWEINSRWDVISRRESVGPYQREKRYFTELAKVCRSAGVPGPLVASVELRAYLAARDVWVRAALRHEIRRPTEPSKPGDAAGRRDFLTWWQRGERAARALWTRTRDTGVRGPNEQILTGDADRVQAWWTGEPVFGPPWQLCYEVENFAPAAQLISVEQQRPDGSWAIQQACHTIEFQHAGIPPAKGYIREHAAPVDWNGDIGAPPLLRITLRGLGQVKIRSIIVTDGRKTITPRIASVVLGAPPPRRGFPRLDWTTVTAELKVSFRAAVQRDRLR